MTTYKPTNLKAWKKADNYCGETFFDYFISVGQHRDSDLLQEYNFKAVLEALGGKNEEAGVIVARSSHWACGWVEVLLIHKDSKLLKKADEIAKQLDDYPVYDDCEFSEFETEALDKQYEENKDWFFQDFCKKNELEEENLTEEQKEVIGTFIHNAFSDCERGNVGADEAWFRSDKCDEYLKHAIENSIFEDKQLELIKSLIKE